MNTHTPSRHPRLNALSSSLSALRCCFRNLPLFFSPRPKTPLRVLCIIAFDLLHLRRHATPLSSHQRKTLAALLDFAASANAALDHKPASTRELRTTRRFLHDPRLHPSLADYTRRLAALETSRPLPDGDAAHFQKIQTYRESVARLSLAMLASASNLIPNLNDALLATHTDPGLNLLFRLTMHCQIIDDLVDYSSDRFAHLPSFLTATPSLPHSLTLTRRAAHRYTHPRTLPPATHLFPLQLALHALSALTTLTLSLVAPEIPLHFKSTDLPTSPNLL